MVSRADRRRATLLQLGEAAIDLFDEIGTSATINEIADRAGVSRRTVFRHVDAKEELAFVHPILWFDVFDEALVTYADLPLPEKLRLASAAIADHIDRNPDPPRRAFVVAVTHPELQRGFNAVYQRWVERVASEVLADAIDPAAPTPAERFRSRIIGSAVMGVVDAVTREWLLTPGRTFTELYTEGFAYIEPLLASSAAPIGGLAEG